MTRPNSVHIDLDGAWAVDAAESAGAIPYVDCRSWGPVLRYSSPARAIEEFYRFVEDHLAPFTLFGSGDFHHLTALWLRRILEPFVLISFDNHPDWDIRPPKWCCGTWMNRALELPILRQASIWGCGNFELNFPGYLFVSGKALREKRLEVWPWKERLKTRSKALVRHHTRDLEGIVHRLRPRNRRPKCVCHRGPRLSQRGTFRNQLGKRPLRARGHCLGSRRTQNSIENHRGRPLRRLLKAHLCPLAPAHRSRTRPPKSSRQPLTLLRAQKTSVR